MKKMTAKRAPAADPAHPKKTFWERLGLFLVSFLASAAFAAVWIVISLTAGK